jgi:hypothetical protein
MLSPRRGARSANFKVGALKWRVALLLLPLFALLAPREAQAYTWMVKHGYQGCNACHTDPSGGELLTLYGRMQSEAVVSMPWGKSHESASLRAPRLARSPLSLAAQAKLADKEGGAEEKVVLEDDAAATTADGDAPADASEGSTQEAAPAEEEGYPDGLGAITPFLFRLWEPPDWLTLGGSYRHMNIITPQSEKKFRTFPMMMDIYGQLQFGSFKAGGSLGGARVAAGSPYARSAQITTNQGKEWNLISRTHYVGYDITDSLSVRAGRLNLPFGVRIPEHTMWVRQASRTDRESAQQHGVSVHYFTADYRFELMGIAGNYQINPDQFRERGYSGYFEYYLNPKTVVGVSSLITSAKNDRLVLDGKSMTRMAHGAMLRAAISESVVFLAEANALTRSRFEPGYVGFAQVDWEPTQGLHFMVTGEMLDNGHSKATGVQQQPRIAGAGKPKVGGWLSAGWWFLPHFDVRLDGIKRTDEDISILAQLHVYL